MHCFSEIASQAPSLALALALALARSLVPKYPSTQVLENEERDFSTYSLPVPAPDFCILAFHLDSGDIPQVDNHPSKVTLKRHYSRASVTIPPPILRKSAALTLIATILYYM